MFFVQKMYNFKENVFHGRKQNLIYSIKMDDVFESKLSTCS